MKVTEFVVPGCPYCRFAESVWEDFCTEEPAARRIEREKISETAHPEIAEQYDYYYTPAFFLGKKKLFEADPDQAREQMRAALGEMLRSLVLDENAG